MAKLLTQWIIGILLLCVGGTFVLRIYQQRDILAEVYHWIISGKYIFEPLDGERMHRQLTLQRLNNSIPPVDKIYKSNFSGLNAVLDKNDIDMCRNYYRLVLEDIPQLQEAHVFLGFCEYKAGNIPEAFSEFKNGLESGAGVFWSSYDLGNLAMISGNKDAAEALFFQVVKLPLQDVMKSIYFSRLFQQYIQINNITPQNLLDGLNEARNDAIQNLKLIDQAHKSNVGFPIKHDMRIRIF